MAGVKQIDEGQMHDELQSIYVPPHFLQLHFPCGCGDKSGKYQRQGGRCACLFRQLDYSW